MQVDANTILLLSFQQKERKWGGEGDREGKGERKRDIYTVEREQAETVRCFCWEKSTFEYLYED